MRSSSLAHNNQERKAVHGELGNAVSVCRVAQSPPRFPCFFSGSVEWRRSSGSRVLTRCLAGEITASTEPLLLAVPLSLSLSLSRTHLRPRSWSLLSLRFALSLSLSLSLEPGRRTSCVPGCVRTLVLACADACQQGKAYYTGASRVAVPPLHLP